MKTKLCVAVLSTVVLSACGSMNIQSPITRTPKFEAIQKVASGEMPASPAAAQQWLDASRQDFRAVKQQANLVCVGIAAVEGSYPSQCLELDGWYKRYAIPLGLDVQSYIDQWRLSGGEGDKNASRYFAELIARRIPEVERLMSVLYAFRGGTVEEPPMLPDLGFLGGTGRPVSENLPASPVVTAPVSVNVGPPTRHPTSDGKSNSTVVRLPDGSTVDGMWTAPNGDKWIIVTDDKTKPEEEEWDIIADHVPVP